MQELLEFLKTDNYLLISNILLIILLILFLIVLISNIKLKNKYKKFMQKIGNGKNIEDDLNNFMIKVNNVEEQNKEIIKYCKNLDSNLKECIQKIGIVRYNAYKDTGSNLSFTVALLDDKNNGVVFNGIYSREMSNIYAKPVENGTSKYTLSEEETEAIKKAIGVGDIYRDK